MVFPRSDAGGPQAVINLGQQQSLYKQTNRVSGWSQLHFAFGVCARPERANQVPSFLAECKYLWSKSSPLSKHTTSLCSARSSNWWLTGEKRLSLSWGIGHMSFEGRVAVRITYIWIVAWVKLWAYIIGKITVDLFYVIRELMYWTDIIER